MHRLRVPPALLASLLLHAGLGLLLQRTTEPPPVVHTHPLEWVTVDVEVEPEPPPPAPRPQPTRPSAKTKPTKGAVREPAPAETAPPSTAEPESDAPRAVLEKPSERGGLLLPASSFGPDGELSEAPRGRTLRPDDPSFDPVAIRAEEARVVKKRVDGWTQDELAEARAQRGLPHPYFSGLREAAIAGLGKRATEVGLVASKADEMRAIGERYEGAASSYGKSGNPNLGPPGLAPRQSEILKDRLGNNPDTMPLQALVQATELMNDLSHGKPLITLTLELRQFRDGAPLVVRVVQPSRDGKFDAFVLEAWPKSIASAGTPPPDAFHGAELRSIWAVEGWLALPKALAGAVSYLPMPGFMGVGADKLLPLTQDGTHYDFQARLLRVY